ncbi:helix-turn-helix transcriptional regulator [Chryseobacterium oranimense]|uniref:response regulator transcription factor n=1 Tax=Chryseobacterium oranimense TaxID=421058 RepID=UPI0021AE58E2|nr:response regulator transcription factor [Chryseobacterium oranimense]UWX60880.1 helix-turn-helix transcriptional regulator [Chryseobacterium oranimense]
MRTDHKEAVRKKPKKLLFCRNALLQGILFLLIILGSVFAKGQSGPDFSILADKAFQKLYQNPDECINYSQSLLISDQNPEHRTVLQNIISQAYAMKGDYVQSVNIYSQKEDSREKEKLSYFLQIAGDYNLADQYQNLDLYHQSQQIITSLLSDPKFLKGDNPRLNVITGKLYQLQAINFGINRSYDNALKNLNKSDHYLSFNNQENLILKMENRIFRASYLMKQNKPEEARHILENTLAVAEKNKNYPFLLAFAYENLSRYYFFKEDYHTAVEMLEKGLSTIESIPYNSLKAKIYESLSKNYFALRNDEKYHQYNKLYSELRTKSDSNTKEGIRYIVKLVETNQNNNLEFQKQKQFKKIIWLSTGSLAIITGLLICFLILKSSHKDLKKQFDFFEKQKNQELAVQKDIPVIAEEAPPTVKTNEKDLNKISKEKEDEILQKLEEWEKQQRYLDKNMTLSMLSSQMGVNTKYLSEVINNSKGKNFNGYINELRINHIALLLRTDPVYLNYKVSYLAEYSGFSSHSAFTTIFKSVTGMSPNVYIQEISKSRAL